MAKFLRQAGMAVPDRDDGHTQPALGTAPLAYTSSKAALDRFCAVAEKLVADLGL
jgi:hypothetical protein